MIVRYKLPDISLTLSEAEVAWLSFLRSMHVGPVRPPTLPAIQSLRQAIARVSGD